MGASSISPVCVCALVSPNLWQVKCSHRSFGYSSTRLTWSIGANLFGNGVAMKGINQQSIKVVSLFLVIPFLAFGQSQPPAADYEWRSYGGGPGGVRVSFFYQINWSNVGPLPRARALLSP